MTRDEISVEEALVWEEDVTDPDRPTIHVVKDCLLLEVIKLRQTLADIERACDEHYSDDTMRLWKAIQKVLP